MSNEETPLELAWRVKRADENDAEPDGHCQFYSYFDPQHEALADEVIRLHEEGDLVWAEVEHPHYRREYLPEAVGREVARLKMERDEADAQLEGMQGAWDDKCAEKAEVVDLYMEARQVAAPLLEALGEIAACDDDICDCPSNARAAIDAHKARGNT